MTLGIFQSGNLSGTVCQLLAQDISIEPTPSFNPGFPYSNSLELLAVSYHITAGTGLTTATVTFQEIGGDGQWRNLQAPAPLTITAPGDYNNNFNGPFHGLRMVLSGIAGGQITFAELQSALVQ